MSKSNGKLTPEEFVMRALETLPDKTKGYAGFHTVFSGFNDAFRQMYPDLNPVEVTKQMELAGQISITPVKRGVMIFPAGEAKYQRNGAAQALEKMNISKK